MNSGSTSIPRSGQRWALEAFSPHRLFLALAAITMVLFGVPLYSWAYLAFTSGIYSHLILIPFVFGYLLHLRKDAIAQAVTRAPFWSRLKMALWPIAFAIAILIVTVALSISGADRLCLTTTAFVLCLFAAGLIAYGARGVRAAAFVFAFLVWMIPFPTAVLDGLEIFFQHASADAASVLFQLTGLPTLRDGLEFRLPGLTIKVAQECSGIRSSLILFITSMLAGYLFLQTYWKRTVLTLFVIPLGILRNAFRILVLAWLTVEVDPRIIDSALHRRGGPLFFALSLIPFFLLLLLLRKSEPKPKTIVPAAKPR